MLAENKRAISRKNLVYSLGTGLVIGTFIGIPIGWVTHRFYVEQRLAQILLCRDSHRNQPEAIVQSICGSTF